MDFKKLAEAAKKYDEIQKVRETKVKIPKTKTR